MARSERGALLLEALVALAITAMTGIAAVAVLVNGVRAAKEDAQRESDLVAAERVLGAYTLLRREDLDLRIGRQELGALIVTVQRPERTLYRIAITHATTDHVEELVTVVYRSAPGDAR